MTTGKLWGGRFEQPTDRTVEEFTASLPFDHRLYRYDIAGSVAHCRMLASQGILSAADAQAIENGLAEIEAEIDSGTFSLDPSLEDIHMAVETRLHQNIGPVAGRLHTARSRNDQVALDTRMYAREAAARCADLTVQLRKALIDLADRHHDTIIPGYTHLQCAQPVLFAHHLLAYVEMLERDTRRFRNAREAADVMPLGAGALAGVPYPIAPDQVSRDLGFASTARNSMDAVSDRDFALDLMYAAAVTMMHLSRFSEEIIIWNSREFSFIEIGDAYCTGSSIMPQKKNPDVSELVRGKTGRVFGDLQSLLVTMKGLPLAYNKDMQEDKEALFDAVDTVSACLRVTTGLVNAIAPRPDAMRGSIDSSYALATDYADYLVGKGLPFRQAHEVVGSIVRWAIANNKRFSDLTLIDLREFSSLFDADALSVAAESSVRSRRSPGGTSHDQVAAALTAARERLDADMASA